MIKEMPGDEYYITEMENGDFNVIQNVPQFGSTRTVKTLRSLEAARDYLTDEIKGKKIRKIYGLQELGLEEYK